MNFDKETLQSPVVDIDPILAMPTKEEAHAKFTRCANQLATHRRTKKSITTFVDNMMALYEEFHKTHYKED